MNNLISYGSEDSDNEITNSENVENSIKISNKANLESEWAFFEQMINDSSVISTSCSSNKPSDKICYPTIKPTYSSIYPQNCPNTSSMPGISPDFSKASSSQPASPNNFEMDLENDDKVSELLDLYYNKWNNIEDENKEKDPNKSIPLPSKSIDTSSDSDTNLWKYNLEETNINGTNLREKCTMDKESKRAKFKEEQRDELVSQSGKSVSSHSSVSTSSSSEDEASASTKEKIKVDEDSAPVIDSTTLHLQQIANESEEHSKKKSNEHDKKLDEMSNRHPLKRSNRSRSRSRSAKRQHRDDQKHKHSHLPDKKSSPYTRHSSRDKESHRRKRDHKDRRSSQDRKSDRYHERKRHRQSSRERKSSERKSHKRSHHSRSRSRDAFGKDETFKDRVKAQMAVPTSATAQAPILSQDQIQLHKDLMMMSKNFNIKGVMPLNSKMAMSAFLAKCTRDKITPQEALMQSMKAMQAKAEAITGVAVPQYYNPTAINPIRYAEQIKKRKMLWSKNKEKEVVEEITPEAKEVQWSSTSFESDRDGKVAAKFRKLMGIKEEAQQQLANIDLSKLSEEQRQKQQELFENLDREYNYARMATHTCRGVGLGYSSQQFFPE